MNTSIGDKIINALFYSGVVFLFFKLFFKIEPWYLDKIGGEITGGRQLMVLLQYQVVYITAYFFLFCIFYFLTSGQKNAFKRVLFLIELILIIMRRIFTGAKRRTTL